MIPDTDDFDDLEAGLELEGDAAPVPTPAAKTRKPRTTTLPAAEKSTAGRTKRVEPEIIEKIDARVPPQRVKHIPTGRVTNWSPLFRRKLQEFAPFYRDDQERLEHRIAVKQAQIAGDPQAMARAIIEQMAAEEK